MALLGIRVYLEELGQESFMESMRAAVQPDDHVVSPLTADSLEGSCFRSTLHKRTFYLLRIAKQNQLREWTLEPDCLGSEPTRQTLISCVTSFKFHSPSGFLSVK